MIKFLILYLVLSSLGWIYMGIHLRKDFLCSRKRFGC